MSYALYVGKNHTRDGHAWLVGYGDEPSSHWLEIVPRRKHQSGETVTVGMTEDADLPGRQTDIPDEADTVRHIRVNYTYYKGAPAPLTNGGLNEHGVAVRDVWSPSRAELVEMTPDDQTGPNYSDLARFAVSRARTAREAVSLVAESIAAYGESSYGGNSHLFADPDEAWVMIQFAGGQGLWVAERLGAESIRASRPGYINLVPVDEPDHPDFLYSENFVSFARSQGWYESGPFDANSIYGDGKGRWDGVRWIEDQMAERAARPEKISFADMTWAVRTARLTGDTAGYGQVVPLVHPKADALRMLWHAPIGPVAAPFSPVFIGQNGIPDEFRLHRYLTRGESAVFMDDRINEGEEPKPVSSVSQETESARSAVASCKRLLYLMVADESRYLAEVTEAFEDREAHLLNEVRKIQEIAEALVDQDRHDLIDELLSYFSTTELRRGLDLVEVLADGIAARERYKNRVLPEGKRFRSFEQVW